MDSAERRTTGKDTGRSRPRSDSGSGDEDLLFFPPPAGDRDVSSPAQPPRRSRSKNRSRNRQLRNTGSPAFRSPPPHGRGRPHRSVDGSIEDDLLPIWKPPRRGTIGRRKMPS